MANLVSGTVIFYRNKDGLNKIKDVLEKIGTDNIYNFIKELDVDYDGDCRYTIYDFDIHDDNISIYVELAWDAHQELWRTIADKYNLEWTGWFDWDNENPSVFNDKYGHWFKENYVLDAEDSPIGDYEHFKTDDEVVDYLEEKTNIRMSPEEWKDKFYDDDWLIENLGEEWEDSYARLWIVDREVA